MWSRSGPLCGPAGVRARTRWLAPGSGWTCSPDALRHEPETEDLGGRRALSGHLGLIRTGLDALTTSGTRGS